MAAALTVVVITGGGGGTDTDEELFFAFLGCKELRFAENCDDDRNTTKMINDDIPAKFRESLKMLLPLFLTALRLLQFFKHCTNLGSRRRVGE